MKKAIKNIGRKMKYTYYNVISTFSDELYTKKIFKKMHGYDLNLKNPKTFSEKIQYRKLKENNDLYTLCSDKFLVREYVSDKIGKEYLIPMLGVYDKLTTKELNKLPNQFVIKANHGSAWNDIVFDKSKIDLQELVLKYNKLTKVNYAKVGRERHYDGIKPKIIIEKLLETNGKVPDDIKIHCFKNKGNFDSIIQVDMDRFGDHRRNFYDSNWNLLNFKMEYDNGKATSQPANLKEMVQISKRLAEDFKYVRVDLYSMEEKIYFGELTFTHGNGFEKIVPYEWDLKLGSKWIINA